MFFNILIHNLDPTWLSEWVISGGGLLLTVELADYDIILSLLIDWPDLNVAGTAASAGEGRDGLGNTARVLEDVDDGG